MSTFTNDSQNWALLRKVVPAVVAASALTFAATKATSGKQRGGGGLTSKRSKGSNDLYAPATSISDAVGALDYLLAAFGPDGRNAKGTAPGTMVASPSKASDGDSNGYYYAWARDTGLCSRSLLECFKQAEAGKEWGFSAKDMERRLHDFFKLSIQQQHTPNPSGTFETGGIGEPKFEVDGSAFQGSWGRPQNDGPALRSLTAILYMQHILSTRSRSDDASKSFCFQHLWSSGSAQSDRLLIRDDLDYICREWKGKTFELWEEVCADAGQGGGHFHVLMTQRRALLEGAKLAGRTECKDQERVAKWTGAARDITQRLERFWNPEGKLELEGGPTEGDNIKWDDERHLDAIPKTVLSAPHVVPTLNRVSGQPKPTQADCAVLLAFTHGWDGSVGDKTDDTWEPWSERCLATLDRNIDVFAAVYPLNKGRKAADGVLCGRYPEDVYDGVQQSIGNPWFLTTFAVSNVLFLTVSHYAQTSRPLKVTKTLLPLFTKAYPQLAQKEATYSRGSTEYELILRGLRRMGEDFLTNAAKYADAETGKMSEQIDRYSGKMRGARELSWSFASWLAVLQARQLV